MKKEQKKPFSTKKPSRAAHQNNDIVIHACITQIALAFCLPAEELEGRILISVLPCSKSPSQYSVNQSTFSLLQTVSIQIKKKWMNLSSEGFVPSQASAVTSRSSYHSVTCYCAVRRVTSYSWTFHLPGEPQPSVVPVLPDHCSKISSISTPSREQNCDPDSNPSAGSVYSN